jgi:hypothetical protein
LEIDEQGIIFYDLIKYLNILLIIFNFRLNIDRLQSMAQIHSFYITNAKSELKFSSSNLNENELEFAVQEITTAMINDDDLFNEEEDNVFSDSESVNLDEENTNDLIMAEIIDLDIPEFGEFGDFRDFEEISEEDNVVSDSIQLPPEDSNINFEAILDEVLD